MRKMMTMARLAGLAALVGLSGCFSLGRTEPPQRTYVLGGTAAANVEASTPGLSGITVGVRRLRLASYLDPLLLVVRQGENRVSYSEFHRWGEHLGEGINRAVAGYLDQRGSFATIDVAPWEPRARYDYVVQLHVERFEGVAPEGAADGVGEAHLLASWEILRHGDGEVLARGTTDHRAPGWRVGDHSDLVRLLDASLDVMSSDLARSLGELGSRQTGVR
jgi:uncharacterized lipoprotein YmbA